jgi:hypothetical protein
MKMLNNTTFHIVQIDHLVQLCVMIFMIVLQESGMTLVTAEDLDDAAEKAVQTFVK